MTKFKPATCTIGGIKLTLGTNIHHHYNLNIIRRYSYQINANGEYDQKHPILDPLNWIK